MNIVVAALLMYVPRDARLLLLTPEDICLNPKHFSYYPFYVIASYLDIILQPCTGHF